MNKGDRDFKKPLPTCPKCGMDSGLRMATTGSTEQYVVKCLSCGAITRLYKTQTAATKAWCAGCVEITPREKTTRERREAAKNERSKNI